MNATVTLRYDVIGTIWMPCATCYKENLTLRDDDFRYSDGSKPTARDFALKATNDGDFQNCSLTPDSYFEVSYWRGNQRHTRRFPVSMFPSIADCVGELNVHELPWDGEDD